MKKKYFKLFSNCIPVKGYTKFIICDLQRNLYVSIPDSLINLFDKNNLLDIDKIKNQLDEEGKVIFDEYLELLNKQEFIFNCTISESKRFPLLNMEWDFSSQATNLILDITKKSKHNYNKILNYELDKINCRFLQLRFFDEISLEKLDKIMKVIMLNEIKSVEIIIKDEPNLFCHNKVAKWVMENRKIRTLTLHSSNNDKLVQDHKFGFGGVIAIKENISSSINCGVIHPTYFSINIETFTESQHHNTCLNRKISIDENGEIKNCPSMPISYGNIRDTKLIDVVRNPNFQKLWHIKKDEITKCKDCEFRHICTDCRAYLDNPDDKYSAPLKCGYDPYTGIWEEWSTNPLKKKAIEFYGMQELVKKED